MTNTSEIRNGATIGEPRFAGQSSYRGLPRPHVGGLPGQPAEGGRGKAVVADETTTMTVPPPIPASVAPTMQALPITRIAMATEPPVPMSAPPRDIKPLTEPVFPLDGWHDDTAAASLADHPLLRGLLLELPPKGSIPPPGWLDRWFEAARSILDLLYLQSSEPHGR